MKKYIISFIAIILAIAGVFVYLFCYPKDGKGDYFIGISQLVGGLISGALTVLGVSWTISHEEKARKQDAMDAEKRQRDSFRPVFQYESNCKRNTNNGTTFCIDCDSTDSNTIDLQLNLITKNVSSNSALNIRFQVIIVGKETNQVGANNLLIIPGETNEYTFHFKIKNIAKSESLRNPYDYDFNYNLKIIIFYNDLIGTNYKQELNGRISGCFETAEQSLIDCINIYHNGKPEIIGDNFQYQLPTELLKLEEKRRKDQIRITEFNKIKNSGDFNRLVASFMSKNYKKFNKYAINTYKNFELKEQDEENIDFKVISENVCNIISECFNANSNYMDQYITYIWILRVNLTKQKVVRVGKKITHNSLPVSRMRKCINNLIFKVFY